jgi:hypothetical protein
MAWIELKCDDCGSRKMQDSSECIDQTTPGDCLELPNPCKCGGEFWIIDYYGNAVSLPRAEWQKKIMKLHYDKVKSIPA